MQLLEHRIGMLCRSGRKQLGTRSKQACTMGNAHRDHAGQHDCRVGILAAHGLAGAGDSGRYAG